MKTNKLFISVAFLIFLSLGALAQEVEKVTKDLPPIKELPKEGEVKNYFEFDKVESYKVYDSQGTLIKKGKERRVDMTELSKGTYYISYGDTKAVYKKE